MEKTGFIIKKYAKIELDLRLEEIRVIRCVVCDLDGTLIKKDDTIEEETLFWLKTGLSQHLELILATGRSWHMVKPILEQYALHADLILNNGAEYRNWQTKEVRYIPMETQAFCQVSRLLNAHGYLLAIHTDHGLYSFHEKDAFWRYHEQLLSQSLAPGEVLPRKTFTIKEKYLRHFHTIQDPQELLTRGVQPLKIDARHLHVRSLSGVRDALRIPHLNLSSSFEDNIEITSDHSDKASLLQEVIKKKGYVIEEVAVFGDGENDCSMLAAFPYSFAPANASQKAKSCARYVLSKTNEEGAVKEGLALLENEGILIRG